MNLTINLRTSDTDRAVRRIREKAPVALARAINRSLASGKTLMGRLVSKDLGLKVSDVRDTIALQEARPDRLSGQLRASVKRIPLIKFGARGPQPSRGRGRGVTARMPGGAGRYPHAFIAQMRSGHVGVFERAAGANRHGPKPNRSQLPIRELFGPSVALVFDKHHDEGLARAMEQLVKNVQHELRFALAQTA